MPYNHTTLYRRTHCTTESPLHPTLLAIRKLLVDRSDLVSHIEPLHVVGPHVGVLHAVDRRLLPPSLLLFTKRLARNAVKHIAALASQPLEVVGHISRRQVRRRITRVGLGLLILPSRIEQFN